MARTLSLALGLILTLTTLLVPGGGAGWADERDRAAEVRGGAAVHAYVDYVGGATGTRSGSTSAQGTTRSLDETRSNEVRWEGAVTLRPASSGGKLVGTLMTDWVADASASKVSHYESLSPDGGSSSSDYRETCEASGYTLPMNLVVEMTPEDAGLRVVLKGYVVPNVQVPGGCRWTRVESGLDGTKSTSGSLEFSMNVALVHDLKGSSYDAEVSFLVPYDGRGSVPFSYSAPVPHEGDIPAGAYCGMGAKQIRGRPARARPPGCSPSGPSSTPAPTSSVSTPSTTRPSPRSRPRPRARTRRACARGPRPTSRR